MDRKGTCEVSCDVGLADNWPLREVTAFPEHLLIRQRLALFQILRPAYKRALEKGGPYDYA